MTYYMDFFDLGAVCVLPFRGHPDGDNDNLPPTDQNFATRFAVCVEGMERGIIAVENDD